MLELLESCNERRLKSVVALDKSREMHLAEQIGRNLTKKVLAESLRQIDKSP